MNIDYVIDLIEKLKQNTEPLNELSPEERSILLACDPGCVLEILCFDEWWDPERYHNYAGCGFFNVPPKWQAPENAVLRIAPDWDSYTALGNLWIRKEAADKRIAELEAELAKPDYLKMLFELCEKHQIRIETHCNGVIDQILFFNEGEERVPENGYAVGTKAAYDWMCEQVEDYKKGQA